MSIHTHGLDPLLIIKSLIKVRNPCLHNWLIIRIFRTSLNPSLEDKSALGPQVAKLGMEDGVTISEGPSLTTHERVAKGSLAKITGRGVAGEVLSV